MFTLVLREREVTLGFGVDVPIALRFVYIKIHVFKL
jgi:hypothetical protein